MILRGKSRLLNICGMGNDALTSRVAKGCAQKGMEVATTITLLSAVMESDGPQPTIGNQQAWYADCS